MKKAIIWIFALSVLISLCGCKHSSKNTSSIPHTGNTVSSSSYESDYTEPAKHTHDYMFSDITKEATCGEEGVITYSCSCGDSYTERIPKSTSHDWESATCTSPKRCKVCGKTEGEARGHTYASKTCFFCGQMHPAVREALEKCSLTLPAYPKEISNDYYSGYTIVKVTNIKYKFETDTDGTIESLKVYFSGTKTFSDEGAGTNGSCDIG
ncbi:MAG: hypothetical protein IKI29_02470 [Clostridia bacterium]|nr:hypothetical protein [Clostridia bacterium]